MLSRLQLWLHRANRIALLFVCLAVAAPLAAVLWLRPQPALRLAGAAAAPSFRLPAEWIGGQVTPGGGSCGPGKICRAKAFVAGSTGAAASATDGDVSSLGSIRTYDSSNLTNNWRQSTFNGTTTFEQNGSAVYSCANGSATCTYVYSILNSGSVTATTYLRSIGAATGSLPACAAGIAGALEYDTTTATIKRCNGSAWHTVGEHPSLYTAFAPSGLATGTREVQRITFDAAATVTQLGTTAVTAGTGAGNYTVDVYNATTTTSLCTSSAMLCSAAVPNNDNINCTGNVSSGDQIALRILSTGCTTSPAVTITAEFTSRD